MKMRFEIEIEIKIENCLSLSWAMDVWCGEINIQQAKSRSREDEETREVIHKHMLRLQVSVISRTSPPACLPRENEISTITEIENNNTMIRFPYKSKTTSP